MATIAVAFPIQPGKAASAREFAREVSGPRRREAGASFGRMGVTHETWYLQATPHGDLMIVYMEAANPTEAFSIWAASNDPYDPWFKDTAGAICGIDFNQPGPPLPEAVMDWSAE